MIITIIFIYTLFIFVYGMPCHPSDNFCRSEFAWKLSTQFTSVFMFYSTRNCQVTVLRVPSWIAAVLSLLIRFRDWALCKRAYVVSDCYMSKQQISLIRMFKKLERVLLANLFHDTCQTIVYHRLAIFKLIAIRI